jgi:hypothetical protein
MNPGITWTIAGRWFSGERSVAIFTTEKSDIEPSKMKESSLGHWVSPNDGATNESGFTALPDGQFC